MKIKLLVIVIALAAGVASSLRVRAENAEPTCPGTGILCATGSDGTSYWKGLGN